MTFDDIKRLATSSLLFSLDRIIAPRLVNIVYLLGLLAIVLWAITHFFATFGDSFGSGLWGLIEIAVFGLLAFVVLRICCEAVIVYFKANEKAAEAVRESRAAVSLIDEVRDAIEELAEEDERKKEEPAPKPARTAAAKPPARTTRATTRTARRTKN